MRYTSDNMEKGITLTYFTLHPITPSVLHLLYDFHQQKHFNSTNILLDLVDQTNYANLIQICFVYKMNRVTGNY